MVFKLKVILPWQASAAPEPLRVVYPVKHEQVYPGLVLMLVHWVFAPVQGFVVHCSRKKGEERIKYKNQ